MGIGQIVVLRLPASRLREVNRVLEDTAWGAYRTEFYPTYDYKAIGLGSMSGRSDGKRVLARDRRLPSRKAARRCVFCPCPRGRSRRFFPNASQVIHQMKNHPGSRYDAHLALQDALFLYAFLMVELPQIRTKPT